MSTSTSGATQNTKEREGVHPLTAQDKLRAGETKGGPQREEASFKVVFIVCQEKRVGARGCNQIGRMPLPLGGLINSMWIISPVKKREKETVNFYFQLSSESHGNIKRHRGGMRLNRWGARAPC